MQVIQDLARPIQLFIMDVDGVLTDGTILITATGEELKGFNALDGHGLKMLQSTGVALAIITGRNANCVQYRARDLGIDYYYAGIHHKREAFQQLIEEADVEPYQCAYIGDDVVDLSVMRRVGLAIAVPEAPSLVRQHAHYVTGARGGRGAVREACELIMQAQGTFDDLMKGYLS